MEAELAAMLLRIEGKLGEVKGNLESLEKAFADERSLAREERRATLLKLEEIDRLHNDLTSLKSLFDLTKVQVYSNKAEIEAAKTSHKAEIDAIKTEHAENLGKMDARLKETERLHTRILGVWAVFTAATWTVLGGVYWVISSWHEVIPFLKSLTGAKP